jgi:hypothetical protein
MRFAVVLLLALAACHHDTPPAHPKPGDLPPLPPASGTPIGYLLDSQSELKLREDQVKQLQEIDASLAVRDAEIDTQLRQIDSRQAAEEEPPPRGAPQKPRNRAPGAAGKPTGDAATLHKIRDTNDRDALRKAWTLLDKDQQVAATKILQEHDVEVPGAPKKQEQTTEEGGTPLPGMEP